jgi:hypothetical protein
MTGSRASVRRWRLILAGYLVREGYLALGPTLAVGIASAVAKDNLGQWLGRLGDRPICGAERAGLASRLPGWSASRSSSRAPVPLWSWPPAS